MLLDKHQQLYHTFLESYIDQGNILTKVSHETTS